MCFSLRATCKCPWDCVLWSDVTKMYYFFGSVHQLVCQKEGIYSGPKGIWTLKPYVYDFHCFRKALNQAAFVLKKVTPSTHYSSKTFSQKKKRIILKNITNNNRYTHHNCFLVKFLHCRCVPILLGPTVQGKDPKPTVKCQLAYSFGFFP